MAGDSFSTGSSFSNSSSQSVPFQGPERDFLLNLAQYNEGLEQQMYNWAQQQFAGTSAVTDEAVGNFLNASQKAMGQADQMWDRYTNTFQPLENQLVADANSYAGAGRIASEMGRAGATVSQGMDQQRQAALRELEGYGIDPSAGKFAALDRAERLQGAAVGAGAQNEARRATEATGRQLRGEAIQVGQRYPQQVMQSMGLGLQGLTGAVNSKLANLATGAQAFGPSEKFGAEAAGLKYPPMQQQSQSRGGSSQNSGSHQQSPQQPQRAPGSGGGGSPNGGGTSMPANQSRYSGPSSGGGGGYGGYAQPAAGIKQIAGGNQTADDWSMPNAEDWANAGGGLDYLNQDQGYQDYGDTDWSGGFGANADWGGNAWDSLPADTGSGAGNYQDTGSSDWGPQSNYDFGSYSDMGGENYYAEGGGVEDDGDSFVNPNMSPSGGQQTDDVSARLNVGEFVIPRDVAMWKGQEFFQKLIDQSRQRRGAAPAKPQMKPALQRPPAFQSQRMGA